MTDSLEQEREALWLRVEELTGVKFINHKEPPEVLAEYSDEAKEAIEKLKNVCQRINNFMGDMGVRDGLKGGTRVD